MPSGGIPMMHGEHTESKIRNCGSDEMNRVTFKRWVLQGMIILMSVMCVVPAFAKGGDTLWATGDLLPHRQEAIASTVDGNGNVIVAGYQNLKSDSDDDFWTVKFNADGTVAWRAVYNRVGGSDQIMALAVDSANNVIVTGYIWNGTNNDIHTIKYSGTDGTVLWQDSYAGAAGGKDIGTSVVVDNANNLVYVGGYTQNSTGGEDYLLLKYENKNSGPANLPVLTLIHPGPNGGRNYINSVALCAGGVAVTGSSWNGADSDFMTIKYGSDGAELWSQRYTSSGSHSDFGKYVKCDQAGNVIVTGTSSNTLDYDIHTIKYRAADGVPHWDVTYNGAFDDEPAGLSVDTAGDVYLTGYTWTLAGNNDFYTAKYNGSTGALLWQQLFDSGKGNADLATATGIVVDEAVDGDVYVTGYSITSGNYDFQTLKYKKESGHLLWQGSFNGAANKSDRPVGISLAPDGNVYVAGWSDKSAQQDGGTVTATGGSKSTIVNAAKSWVVNQWKDYFVYLTSGNNTGDFRKILSNTSNTLTVAVDFGDAVTAGTGYYLYDKDDYDLYLIKYDKGSLNPPTNLTANTISKAVDGKFTIQLTWEDNSANETGFKIERKLGDQSSWSSATTFTVGANVTSFEDTGLIANNYYYYRVKAYNATEETYPGNEAHALTFLVTYQVPVWSKITDGGYNLEDDATAIAVGPDNNPVVTGYSDSGDLGTFDFFTIKYNRADGIPLWTNRYDSQQNELDQAKCLTVDNNNDVVVSGQSSLYNAAAGGNINSVFTMKYTSAGDSVLWEHQYNGPGAIDDRSTAIASASDGSSSVITGYGKNSNQDEDIYLLKYSIDGTLLWAAEPYNGGRNDFPAAVVIDKDGNIVITGYTQNSFGQPTDTNNYDFFTAKYNGLTGVMIWHDHYNVTGSGDNKAKGIAADIKGDIYITGYATNAAGNEDFYTIKYDGSNGNRIWERFYDGPVSGNDRAVAIKVDPVVGSNPLDGNIVVVGTQVTAAGDKDIKVIRYSSDGAPRWERTLQRPDINDTAVAMAMDAAGYIYIAGDTGSDLDTDIISIIYDYEGTLLGGTIFNGGNGFDEASAITVNHQGEAFIAGSTTNASGNLDYAVYKQKNNYILAPSPFAVTSQALYSQLQLTWSNNTPNTNVVIDRTLGPITENSVWVNRASYTNPAPVTFLDTGLTENTQYCYRIEAFSGTLPSRKLVTCATTTLPMPALTVSSVTTTQLTISWDNLTGNTGYKVERKIGTGAWALHPNGTLGANTTTFTDTGLTAGSLYTYRVTTLNSAGSSLASNEKIVWTLPVSPAGLSVNNSWANRVDLSWGNVTGETGYYVQRRQSGIGVYSNIATLGTDVLNYSDTTVAANTAYDYRIASYNSSGENTCTPLSVLTKASAVVQKAATKPAVLGIDLSWNDIANETAYIIQESYCSSANSPGPSYCNNNFYGTDYWSGWAEVARTGANTTSYSRTGLTSGYQYRYRIIAEVPGNTTETSNLKGAWAGLSTAITLTTAPASITSLSICWNDILGETAYQIWRKQGQTGVLTKIADTAVLNTTCYTDTGLATQTEYCYQVTAVNTLVNPDSLAPFPVSSGLACLPTPLPAPVLTTPPTAQSTTQLTVNWTVVPGSSRYELERCQYTNPNDPLSAPGNINNPGYWNSCTIIPVASPSTSSYVNTGLTAGYTYRYRIKDYYGTLTEYSSVWSDPIIAGTLLAGPPTFLPASSPSGTQMTLNWTDIIGETGYKLGWKPRTGVDCSAGTWNTVTLGQNIPTYTLNGLTAATLYCFQIDAFNNWGETPYSGSIIQTTALNAPVLATPSNITTSCVTLNWGNLTGNTGYKVWKKIGSGGTYTPLLPIVALDVPTYTDCTLSAGTYYAYQVEALNAGGVSARSNEQAFTSTPAKTTLTAAARSTSVIEITWSLRLGATHYKIERRLGANGSWAQIPNNTTTIPAPYAEDYCGASAPSIGCLTLTPASKSYLDQDVTLQAGTTYYYRVRPWNTTGNDGEYSDPDLVTTPSMPSATLTATPGGSFTVNLSWIPGACIVGTCEAPDGYEIEKAYGKNFFSRIATVPAPLNTYTQRIAIDPNTRHTYRVRAYHGLIDMFDKGVNPSSWGQHGEVYTVLGAIWSTVSNPPINIQGSNGVSVITPANGGVMLHTSSPNAGHPVDSLGKYSHSQMSLLDFTKIHDNFDVQIDYSLPDAPVTATKYHVYGRLHIDFPAGTGLNYAYVERSVNSYGANIIINGVSYPASFTTKDTIGKLRLTRMGDVISAYAWTGGKWVLIQEASGFSTAVATGANLTQYVQRNEAVSLKIIFDNYEATTQRPAYSNDATATTSPYVTGANTCQ